MDIRSVIGDYKSFLAKIFKNLSEAGFSLDEFEELDHIAYRTSTLEKYEVMKGDLRNFCLDSSEVEISGRPILVCKLKEPLIYNEYKINCLELIAPKDGKQYDNVLEHAEFVTKMKLKNFLEKYNNIEFNMNAFNREINPELAIEFKDCAIKFHEQSLLKIRKM